MIAMHASVHMQTIYSYQYHPKQLKFSIRFETT